MPKYDYYPAPKNDFSSLLRLVLSSNQFEQFSGLCVVVNLVFMLTGEVSGLCLLCRPWFRCKRQPTLTERESWVFANIELFELVKQPTLIERQSCVFAFAAPPCLQFRANARQLANFPLRKFANLLAPPPSAATWCKLKPGGGLYCTTVSGAS